MAGNRRERGRMAALVAAVLCLVVPLLSNPTPAAGSTLPVRVRITSICHSALTQMASTFTGKCQRCSARVPSMSCSRCASAEPGLAAQS